MSFDLPLPPISAITNGTMADTTYDRIEQHVKRAQAGLDDDEVLTLYHYLPSGEALVVTDIGYHNPYLMRFTGTDSAGNDCDVLCHFSATNLLLRRTRGSAAKRPIGFTGSFASGSDPTSA